MCTQPQIAQIPSLCCKQPGFSPCPEHSLLALVYTGEDIATPKQTSQSMTSCVFVVAVPCRPLKTAMEGCKTLYRRIWLGTLGVLFEMKPKKMKNSSLGTAHSGLASPTADLNALPRSSVGGGQQNQPKLKPWGGPGLCSSKC